MARIGGALAVISSLVWLWAGADALQQHKARKRAQQVAKARKAAAARGKAPARAATLGAVGPRLLSNARSYPLMVWGWDLRPGLRLKLGEQVLQTHFVDDRHLTTRIPQGLEVQGGRPARMLTATLLDPAGGPVAGSNELTVINDLDYPVPTALALSPDGAQVVVASASSDRLWVADADGAGDVRQVAVGDEPLALQGFVHEGTAQLAVLHGGVGEVWLMAFPALAGPTRRIALATDGWNGLGAADFAIDVEGDALWVSVPARDEVLRYALGSGAHVATTVVGKRPGPLATTDTGVVSGEGPMGGLSSIGAGGERVVQAIPRPGTPIVGGGTAEFSQSIMGGTSLRDVVYSRRHGVALASSIGPNIGPNPQRMEVSMNGGIAVVDPAAGRVVRHVALPHGVPQGLALDDARGLLYVADVATGRVFALSVAALASERDAGDAIVATLELLPPEGTMLLRQPQKFGAEVPSPVSLHTGPWALSLAGDGRTLHVLERLTGRVTRVDVSDAARGVLAVVGSRALLDLSKLKQRRVGEVVFFTDLGDSRMSCDGCHRDGHGEGVLYTKSDPLHVYRVPTLRNIRETPPYFTPALIPSLPAMGKEVLGRNRYHRPPPVKFEVAALSVYQASLVVPPNPLRGARGELPRAVALPDGGTGDAVAGLWVFEHGGRCIECHAGPVFSNDQRPATRGQTFDVGTPVTLPLRPELQDGAPYKLPPPSLSGVRDNYPLLHSGAGGLGVEGDELRATHPFALRRVLELGHDSGKHGGMHMLSPRQQGDLLAYLLTL